MKHKILNILFCCFITIWDSHSLNSQTPEINHQWWADNVHWDGVSHWSDYIIHGAGYLGPDGLPPPEASEFYLPESSISLLGQSYFQPGEWTVNPEIKAFWKITDQIGIGGNIVPFEIFNTSYALKKERKVFYLKYDKTFSGGDTWLYTKVKIPFSKSFRPILRFGFKSTSGTELGAARHTDAPGYYADLAFGDTILNTQDRYWNWSLNLGFFSWQTNDPEYLQDDGGVYGLTTSYQTGNTKLQFQCYGYIGYLKIRDTPGIISILWEQKISKKNAMQLQIRKGFISWPWTSITCGYKWIW